MIVIYQKPTCTTCRQVHAALVEAGVDFDAVDYYTDSLPKAKLQELLRKLRIPARDLLRTKEAQYKALGLADTSLSEEGVNHYVTPVTTLSVILPTSAFR